MRQARRNVWDLDIDVLEDDLLPSWRAELADLPVEDVDWVFREVPRTPAPPATDLWVIRDVRQRPSRPTAEGTDSRTAVPPRSRIS